MQKKICACALKKGVLAECRERDKTMRREEKNVS